jgi:hypothetical protein
MAAAKTTRTAAKRLIFRMESMTISLQAGASSRKRGAVSYQPAVKGPAAHQWPARIHH